MEEKDYNKALDEARQAQEIALQKKALIQRLLTPDAYERLANIRAANPSLYSQLVDLIIALYQAGRIKARLDEKALQELISRVLPKKRGTNIKVKR